MGSSPEGARTPNASAACTTVHCMVSPPGFACRSIPLLSDPPSIFHLQLRGPAKTDANNCCSLCLPSRVAFAPQNRSRLLAIVEINLAFTQHLIRLVPFSCEQNDVARARVVESNLQRAFSVRLRAIFRVDALQTDGDVVDDQQRIFAARIVA